MASSLSFAGAESKNSIAFGSDRKKNTSLISSCVIFLKDNLLECRIGKGEKLNCSISRKYPKTLFEGILS
ncbi:MAG: hypothetical protein ACI85O_000897 [Saprospiraceae bacterium]|jgi:hypothetical protein